MKIFASYICAYLVCVAYSQELLQEREKSGPGCNRVACTNSCWSKGYFESSCEGISCVCSEIDSKGKALETLQNNMDTIVPELQASLRRGCFSTPECIEYCKKQGNFLGGRCVWHKCKCYKKKYLFYQPQTPTYILSSQSDVIENRRFSCFSDHDCSDHCRKNGFKRGGRCFKKKCMCIKNFIFFEPLTYPL